jgi:hypothetical protein
MRTRSIFALGVLTVLSVSTVWAQDPRNLPLLDPAALAGLNTYSFQYPTIDGAGGRLTYGAGAIGVSEDGNYLYVSCELDNSGIAKIEIPPPGGMARVVAPCQGPNAAEIAKIHPNPNEWRPVLGGVFEQAGRITVTGYITYDAGGQTVASHWSGPSLTALQGPFGGTVKPGMVKSQMAPVPQEWRAILGGPAMSSAGYTSIISRASYGASISIFDPKDVTRNQFPMAMLLGCPHSVPSCNTWNTPTSNDYNGSERSGGMFIVPGTRTLFVVEREASGPTCYGYATTDQALHGTPYPTAANPSPENVPWCYSLEPTDLAWGKGPKGYPYRLVAKLYDLAELAAVKQGLKQPWDIRQYATVDMPGSSPGEFVTSGAFNPVRGEYYLIRYFGDTPTVFVYTPRQVVMAPPSPNTLRATANGSTVLLSWQGGTGASVSSYIIEAGSAPGAADIVPGAPVGVTGSYLATSVPPGTYYVRVRATGQGGLSAPSNEVVVVVGGGGGVTGPPARPEEFRATVAPNRSVTFTWWSPGGPPPSSYSLEAGSAPGRADVVNGWVLPVSSSFAVPGAPPGVYYVRLRAINSAGASPPSNELQLIVP